MMNLAEITIKVREHSLNGKEILKAIIKEAEEIKKEHPDINIYIEVQR